MNGYCIITTKKDIISTGFPMFELKVVSCTASNQPNSFAMDILLSKFERAFSFLKMSDLSSAIFSFVDIFAFPRHEITSTYDYNSDGKW